MGQTKNLMMLMQDQEIQTRNFLPTKKEVQLSSKKFVKEIIDNGEIDTIELLTQAVRINEALQIVTDELKNSIPQENFEAFGVKGTYRNGGSTLNYSEDPIYNELKEKLKEREELLKASKKISDPVYDSEGIEVPKVSESFRKSSLSISF